MSDTFDPNVVAPNAALHVPNLTTLPVSPSPIFGLKAMAALSSSDLVVIIVVAVLGGLYLFKDNLLAGKVKDTPLGNGKAAPGTGNGLDIGADSRDFIAKLKATVSLLAVPPYSCQPC